MKIGLVTTVKNEQALLRRNLLYHHYLGVDEGYVYADDPADGTIQTVADLPFVRPRSTVPADRFREHGTRVRVAGDIQSAPTKRPFLDALGPARQYVAGASS